MLLSICEGEGNKNRDFLLATPTQKNKNTEITNKNSNEVLP